jgi:hypothetical protein
MEALKLGIEFHAPFLPGSRLQIRSVRPICERLHGFRSNPRYWKFGLSSGKTGDNQRCRGLSEVFSPIGEEAIHSV